MRFSIGAVNVATGNFVYFDNQTHTIRPDHVMASGALPPSFPAVEIDGEYYWTRPRFEHAVALGAGERPAPDTLAFQVDLWNARGNFPRTMAEVMTVRRKSSTKLHVLEMGRECAGCA